jgi:hypothetical protein
MSLAKRLKQMTTLKMATHSGTFQCDEALGVWMLRQLPKWRDAELVRSRDSAVLDAVTAEGGIVIDVGGRYDPDALRFDHHQRGFFETFDGAPGAPPALRHPTAPPPPPPLRPHAFNGATLGAHSPVCVRR